MRELTADISCPSSHVTLQICYLFALQTFLLIQAFRGRKLPGLYNEAMTNVYTSFTAITLCIATLPVFFVTQQTESSKATLQCFILTIINFSQICMLYGKRFYLVLFQQHKNTREYIRSKMTDETLKNLNNR